LLMIAAAQLLLGLALVGDVHADADDASRLMVLIAGDDGSCPKQITTLAARSSNAVFGIEIVVRGQTRFHVVIDFRQLLRRGDRSSPDVIGHLDRTFEALDLPHFWIPKSLAGIHFPVPDADACAFGCRAQSHFALC